MKEQTLTTSFGETPISFPYYVKWNLYLEGEKSKQQKQNGVINARESQQMCQDTYKQGH